MASIRTPYPPARRSARPAPKRARRIALFTGAYNHIADGVSLTLNRLVSYLEREGAEVLVFAPTVDDPPVDHAGTLVPVPSAPLLGRPEYRMSLGLPASARARLAEFAPDLFHIATPDLLGYRALKLARKWSTPVVASYHTHFSSYLKYYGFGALENLMWKYLRGFYRQCEHVYVPSPSMEAVLREHDIHNGLRLWQRGVDTSRFNPDRRSLAWRRSLGIADDEVVVSFIGRLVWEKGLNIFADVVEGLSARGIAHRSLVVGDGPAYAELSNRLPDTLFTGYLEGDNLARAYASSDVFLFPSDTETFGNVTLEAMASGLPAVCADATGSNALVQHGTTGMLMPPGESGTFLDAVSHLVLDPTLRERMGKAALTHARRYEWEAILARIVDYYDELLSPDVQHAGDGYSLEPAFSEKETAFVH